MSNRTNILNSRKEWDFIFGTGHGPVIKINFDGDMRTWEQVKDVAEAQGILPDDLLRYALYHYLESGRNNPAARARYMAHKEWERTRPVFIGGRTGGRWVSADQLTHELSR